MGPYCKWHKSIVCFFFSPPQAAILPILKVSITSLLHQSKIPPKKKPFLAYGQHSFLLAKLCRREKFKNQTFENEVIF
jgi:hypothetical protein